MSEESTWVGQDGTFGDVSAAPETVRSVVNNKGFTTIEDLAKSYTNLESMKGEWNNPSAMKLPESFSDDQMAQIKTKMGVPDSPDKYTFEGNLDLTDPGIADFLARSHNVGKTQSQITEDLKFYSELIELGTQQETEASEAAEKAIREAQGDKYDSYMESTSQVAEKLGELEGLKEAGLDKHPQVLALLDKVSKMTEEGSLPPAQTPVKELSKEDKLKQIKANPAFMDRTHPEHKAVVSEFQGLFNIG